MWLFGNNKKINYVEVSATVVSVAETRASGSRAGNSMVYQPTFSYEWKGFTRTVESPVWATFYNFNIGDKVTLLVDPDNGSNFKFKDDSLNPMNFLLRTILFIVFVIIMLKIRNNM